MGLFKGMLFLSGVPVRPSTTRERSRGYQREANKLSAEANDLLEEQVRSLEQLNRKLIAAQNQQINSPIRQKSEPTTVEKLEMISRLHDLHTSGVLTSDEYESQKQAILKTL